MKENRGLKFQFLLGDAKKRLGSSVPYYQAREQRFWADLKAWERMPKASPSPYLVCQANFGSSQTKIAIFFFLSKLAG